MKCSRINLIERNKCSCGKDEFMIRIEGHVLPLGVTNDENGANFSVEVPVGAGCKLKLYKKNEVEASFIYEMEEDARIKGIRFLKLIEMGEELTEYVYEIDGEDIIDSYALEVTGRRTFGVEPKGAQRGRLLDRKELQGVSVERIPEEEVIAYRLHVRGFTNHVSSKVKAKGTFQGLVEKIPYLKDLGINQVQLLPAFEFLEEGMKINYWGYTPGYYMAPKSAYSYQMDATEEFGSMVQAFHENGMEVILDMPFVDCPSFSYQVACLRNYILRYQVDGFVLNPYTTYTEEMKKDPIVGGAKLLIQQEEFQMTMRKFLKGDEGMVKDVMWQLRKLSDANHLLSYNYITNHNGFTMADLVSYDGKHNELNGEKNQDGNEYNYCWNCGAEGPTRKKAVAELRKVQMRNAWTLLMLAQGTPCILAGDEFANSQKGNNNAYCQDNEISWLDWRQLAKQKELYTFVKELIALRKSYPTLHQGVPLQGMDSKACGLPDVSYHGAAAWITPDEVASRQLGVLYSGNLVNSVDCYVAYNMHWIEHEYALPTPVKGKKWYQILDTSTGTIGEEILLENQRIAMVLERSIAVYICK